MFFTTLTAQNFKWEHFILICYYSWICKSNVLKAFSKFNVQKVRICVNLWGSWTVQMLEHMKSTLFYFVGFILFSPFIIFLMKPWRLWVVEKTLTHLALCLLWNLLVRTSQNRLRSVPFLCYFVQKSTLNSSDKHRLYRPWTCLQI